MLSLFPTLLSYNMAVPLLFRIIVGLTFLSFAYDNLTSLKASKAAIFEKIGLKSPAIWLWLLITIEVLGGGLFIVGLWTQAASLTLSTVLLLAMIVKYKKPDTLPRPFNSLFFLLVITLSLLFLGPGFYALDLPL